MRRGHHHKFDFYSLTEISTIAVSTAGESNREENTFRNSNERHWYENDYILLPLELLAFCSDLIFILLWEATLAKWKLSVCVNI